MKQSNAVILGFAITCMTLQSNPVSAQDAKASAARPIGNIGDWFPQSSMPAESVVRGQVGAVVIAVELSASGAVIECRVVESSSYPLLDAAACERVKSVGRFEPARSENGKYVKSALILPRLRYVLSRENRSVAIVDENRSVYNSTIQLVVGRSGNIETCRSLNADTSNEKACAMYSVGKPAPAALGITRGATVTVSNTVVVDRDHKQ